MLTNIFATAVGSARFSPCGRYRYTLHRSWGKGDRCCFVMLNPSTADADIDDPTVNRCGKHARRWGHGGLVVVNLFALRSPYPRDLYLAEDRGDGWENDDTILDAAKGSALVVCAWGNHGRLDQRGARVARMLEASGCHLWCFGLTGSQQPRHPLYLRSDSQLLQMPAGLVGAAGDGEQR